MAVAAQAQLEKVRADAAKSAAQQSLDRNKFSTENQFKHTQLHAKTSIDAAKLDIEASKAGLDHHIALAQLATQLNQDQRDSDAADQDAQIKSQQLQGEQQAQALQHQQAENDAQTKVAQLASQHMQSMAQIASQHTQAMTKMAADHHATMTGHATKLHDTHSKLIGGALTKGAEMTHQSQEAGLDRRHDAVKTAATLGNAQTIAKMKPKPGAKK